MDKTTVYLPQGLKAAVKRAAAQRGVSEAEVIRESIRTAVGNSRPAPRGALYSGSLRAAVIIDAELAALKELSGGGWLGTLDRRHFTVVRPIGDGRFTILP